MAQHKSAIPIQEKEINVAVKQHPWARTVKDFLTQKIKYAHNSVKNPRYPVKQHNQPDSEEYDSERVQLTVIGDRVTKEFIFCSNLVKGLHKYRWKNFDVPVIRGVSTVEWPHVWNDLKIRYGSVANCLLTSVAVFKNDQIVGGETELKQLVEKKYIYHLCLDYYNEGVAEFARFVRSSGRPTAYMHVSIDDEHIGTLIFMLYADIVPYTCENFLRLCKERRGGYGGTPVHRIVKDGWIQCGGFGLKSTPLSCENFIIPFDQRGVLAMANDGRDIDCSTQFFVLLQPAPWMNHKYVAFGQLIEGAATLEKIESVTTWYESPTSKIILYRCGILNMECQEFSISKGVNDYIYRHIEDLTNLADQLWENILEKVFLTAQLREVERLREQDGEGYQSTSEEDAIRPTQRFKKEDIQKQIEKNQEGRPSAADTNTEFDVDEYVYEPEEDDYTHQSLRPNSPVVKAERPYYLPLTDVPYPGDVESDFDLKRLLQGKYCLESDLDKNPVKKGVAAIFTSELLAVDSANSPVGEELDSESDEELKAYLKDNVDRVSYAGEVVRSIAQKDDGKFNLFEDQISLDSRKIGHITDEKLRKIKLATSDLQEKGAPLTGTERKGLIDAPDQLAGKTKQRQTDFAGEKDLESIRVIDKSEEDDNSDSKSVRLNPLDVIEGKTSQPRSNYVAKRRPTGFIRSSDFAKLIPNYDDDDLDDDDDADDDDDKRKKRAIRYSDGTVCEEEENGTNPSILARLFKEVEVDNLEPTLKSYKPIAEIQQRKTTLITYSPIIRFPSNESSTRAKYSRPLKPENTSVDQILEMQHGKNITRKISSDYVRTIEKDNKLEHSIRSVEYAKTRPTMSVAEYRLKNRQYQEGLLKMSNEVNTVMMMPDVDFGMRSSIEDLVTGTPSIR